MYKFDTFIGRMIGLPRLIRISIVAFFALMVVAMIFPLVDYVYIRFFFNVETVLAPALVTMAFGGLFYLWGWFTYVGTVGTIPSARKAILWYFVVGSIATILVLGLLIYGVFDLNLPIETA